MSQFMEYFEPQQKTAYASLPFIMRPARNERFIVFASEHERFEAFIHQDVKESISQEAHKATPNETIGLLAGRVLRDERGPYTLVLAAHGARIDEIEATPSHVRISANGHAQVRARLENSAYGLDIIGWYHSHPRYPARFSPVDVTEQSTWPDPNHLGIVISGNDAREPLGVYRGPQATLLTLASQIPGISDSKGSDQPTAILIHPPGKETKDEVAIAPEMAGSANAVHLVNIISEGILRVLPWALAFGLLGSVVGLIRLDRRISKIEERLSNEKLDKETTNGAQPLRAPTPFPSSSFEQHAVSGEPALADKPISVDNPATKTHPLLPVAGQASKDRLKSRNKLKRHTKDVSRSRRASRRNQPAPKNRAGASAPSDAVKQGSAPGNRSKSQPEGGAGKSVKP